MRTRIAALAVLAMCAACGPHPAVVQGRTVSFDTATGTLVMTDEALQGAAVELATTGAEIGARPEPGDELRVAFVDRGGRKVATRVMNLTRQAELRRGQPGGH